jgi:hypothetical protein
MQHLIFFLLVFMNISFTSAQLKFALAHDSLRYMPIRINQEDSVSLLRFYISNIHIEQGRKIIWEAHKKHYLIDFTQNRLATNIVSGTGLENIKKGRLKFTLGVDHKTASQGIGEGPLDPIQGMYWTWQSGYINFKLEGVSSKCPSRKNRFQLHLGGFQKPFRSAQIIELQITGTRANVVFNIHKFLAEINLREAHSIMSPGEKAVSLMEHAKRCFYVQ